MRVLLAALLALALPTAAWADEESRDDLAPGQFGENLTTEGFNEADVHIGDRFRAGTALLEVSQPRVPCYKLGIRMGDPAFPKRFLQSRRSGWYLRVIEEGAVGAGDEFLREHSDPEAISIHTLYENRFGPDTDSEFVRRAVEHPALSGEWKRELRELLGRN